MLALTCHLSHVSCQLSAVPYHLSAVSGQLLAVIYKLLVVTYYLSVVNCQLRHGKLQSIYTNKICVKINVTWENRMNCYMCFRKRIFTKKITTKFWKFTKKKAQNFQKTHSLKRSSVIFRIYFTKQFRFDKVTVQTLKLLFSSISGQPLTVSCEFTGILCKINSHYLYKTLQQQKFRKQITFVYCLFPTV